MWHPSNHVICWRGHLAITLAITICCTRFPGPYSHFHNFRSGREYPIIVFLAFPLRSRVGFRLMQKKKDPEIPTAFIFLSCLLPFAFMSFHLPFVCMHASFMSRSYRFIAFRLHRPYMALYRPIILKFPSMKGYEYKWKENEGRYMQMNAK